ncbi:hypothetical protein LNQ49_18565 [Flavobacterium sp. F-65]|uniref:Chaperone of endosialidase n=1 Tax=Flavobacterium pisciphilum TaxID=2893755 RepID=A0ABS8MXS2_9FLAO|nr:hypothetical protein [Flavobacterium sp. F-65]MCC9073585.1 hypothetical protein [Flavobacterium sp. F-65]
MKINLLSSFIIMSISLSIKAQNTTFNNVSIGTDVPASGVQIKANFPGVTAGWARGFRITNEDGTQNFIGFGAFGGVANGISSLKNAYIGKDWDSQYMTFLANGNIGIGTTEPTTKLDVYGTIKSYESTLLKTTPNSFQLINEIGGNTGSNNKVINRKWLLRDATSNDWLTARLHDGISVDVSFMNPHVDTRTWWERDPNDNIQSWGNSADTYLTINKGKVGIGTTNPIEILNVNGGTGEGAQFDTKMALTKTSSTGNIQSAKIVLNAVDSNFGNLVFKVKTTASKAEIEDFYTDALTIKGSDANVGIGTNSPIEKFNINGGTGEGAQFDTKMALTKTSSTGNIQSAKIVLNAVDSNFGNLVFKVKTTASKAEIEDFYTDALTIKGSNANIGIGTNSPIEKFNINGGTGEGAQFDTKMALTKTSSTGNIQSAKIVLNAVDSNFGNLVFKVKTTASKAEIEDFYTDALTIKGSNANIGIGTSNPDEKLTVKGKIHAQEVRIDLNFPAPDYVFANDYKLKSLKEVEEFIKQNSHLPEIPSAKEIEKNGLMLAEMNMSLLKKIEELTLYSIEQSKKILILEKQNEKLLAIEKRLEKIEMSSN